MIKVEGGMIMKILISAIGIIAVALLIYYFIILMRGDKI